MFGCESEATARASRSKRCGSASARSSLSATGRSHMVRAPCLSIFPGLALGLANIGRLRYRAEDGEASYFLVPIRWFFCAAEIRSAAALSASSIAPDCSATTC